VIGPFAWQRRQAPDAGAVLLLKVAVAEWSLAYAFQMGGADFASKVFWIKIKYLGIVTVPATWLSFALQLTGQEKWLTRFCL